MSSTCSSCYDDNPGAKSTWVSCTQANGGCRPCGSDMGYTDNVYDSSSSCEAAVKSGTIQPRDCGDCDPDCMSCTSGGFNQAAAAGRLRAAAALRSKEKYEGMGDINARLRGGAYQNLAQTWAPQMPYGW